MKHLSEAYNWISSLLTVDENEKNNTNKGQIWFVTNNKG